MTDPIIPTRTPVLDGKAVLLVNDGNAYGVEFPEYGSPDNPTEPYRLALTFDPSVATATAMAIARAILGI